MQLPLFFARRYLVSKKSLNIINVISFIAIIGIAFGTAALFVILSVFNGFENVIKNSVNNFNPDLKVVLKKGKKFKITDSLRDILNNEKNIAAYSFVIEENAIAEFQHKQAIITLLGVEDNFKQITGIDTCLYSGNFFLKRGPYHFTVIGYGIASVLGVAANSIAPITIWTPSNTSANTLNFNNAFNSAPVYVSGIFSIQEDYDNKYIITDYDLAAELLNYQNYANTIYIKVFSKVNIDEEKKSLQKKLGENFKVENRYEQNKLLYKMMNTEHWLLFAILSFILFVSSFNIIGSIIMLIVEKQKDIATLFSLGATVKLIRKIFLTEGFLISLIGAIIGLFIGISLAYIQQKYGIITLPSQDAFIISVYPVKIKIGDIFLVLFTVLAIGYILSIYPVRYITKKVFITHLIT